MKKLYSIGRVLSYLITGLLALVLVCNLYTIVMRHVVGEQQPTVLGYSTAIVISGSMSGSIEINDMVIIHEEDEYATGDVITFRSGENLVTHRIIDQTEAGFVTKGDANNAEDLDPVPQENVIGKVVLVIPRIGMMIEGMRTPLGMTVIVLVGFLLIEIPALLERRKTRDLNEEEQ